jgi:hypothetical protein
MKWLALVVLLAMPRPAEAGEGTLVSPVGETVIFVWKNADALSEGRALLRAKADIRTITPLIACVPPPGTRVVEASDDPGLYLRSIIVADGQWVGCRGVVQKDRFRRRD